MPTKGTSAEEAYVPLQATGLLQRLLQRARRSPATATPQDPSESALDSLLPPPGRRSGKGAASLEPYLDHFRSTRPASLD